MDDNRRQGVKPLRIKIGARASLAAMCGAVAVVGLLLAAAALGSVKKGATYKGTTSERGTSVSFKVSSNGTKVLNFSTVIGYDGKCGQGGGPIYTVRAGSIALHPNGSFKTTVTGTLGPVHANIAIIGHISGSKATGVVEKTPAARCFSNNALPYQETFTAKAK